MTDELAAHRDAVEILYKIRLDFVKEAWMSAFTTATGALERLQPASAAPSINLAPQCLDEVNLARDFAAYTICCSHLSDAIYSGRLKGNVLQSVTHCTLHCIALRGRCDGASECVAHVHRISARRHPHVEDHREPARGREEAPGQRRGTLLRAQGGHPR